MHGRAAPHQRAREKGIDLAMGLDVIDLVTSSGGNPWIPGTFAVGGAGLEPATFAL